MWLALLPVLLALMISPARTLAVILLLHTPKSWRTALAFVGGMATVMMFQAILFGFGMSIVGLASEDLGGDFSLVAALLYLFGGIILLAGAFKMWKADPNAKGQLGAVMAKLETVDPSGARNVGAGWLVASPKQWVFVSTAVAVIFAAQLRPVAAIGTFALLTLLVQTAYILIIVGFVVAHDKIAPALDAVFDWIRGRLRVVAITLFSLLGIMFLVAGVSALT